jgi:2-polyprenyl-6-hydroxyphenyl methylase/3-demethylubiquinone-9 3-methyltransferase
MKASEAADPDARREPDAVDAAASGTVDAAEVARFGAMASEWWDPRGSSALLHKLNPVRLAYIREQAIARFDLDPTARAPFLGLRALDVGCGGGLLAEPLARLGATVTGLDPAAESIAVAEAHARLSGLDIDYRQGSLETLPESDGFDLVTCLEVAEHVSDRDLFFARLAHLLRPGGVLIFSTPNRTASSWAAMILGAEWILRALPRGTHDWSKFIRPEEMRATLAAAGLRVTDMRGVTYSPARGFTIGRDLRVNYIGAAIADAS